MSTPEIMRSAVIDDRGFVQLGQYKVTFETYQFGKDFEERAKNELREEPEIVKAAIRELQRLVKEEMANGLQFPVNDEDRLKVFLRPCKYYSQSAFEKIKKFYQFKLKTKYYDDLLPSLESNAFELNIITVLPLRNRNGERLLVVEAGKKWDTKRCTLTEILRSIMIALEIAFLEPRTQVSGVHVLLDVEGLSLNHVWQFTPMFAKHVVEWVQDCIPIRLKGIHIINQPYLFNMIFALFKPFLGEKLRRRIHFHGKNFDQLKTFIDESALPKQHEGHLDIPMTEGTKLHSYLCEYEQEFKERLQDGYVRERV